MMDEKRIVELLIKKVNQEITNEEHRELDEWVNELPVTNRLIIDKLTDKAWVAANLKKNEAIDMERRLREVESKVEYPLQTKQRPVKRIILYAAAAVIVFALAVPIYFLLAGKKDQPAIVQTNPSARFKNDILPSPGKATLTLANGQVVVLEDVKNDDIAEKNGVVVVKKGNQLLYKDGSMSVANGEPLAYNTLTTPRGTQFNIKLPDGTAVWLNAGSSLRYPIAFNSKERNVELTGEAYFEVAPLTPKGSTGKIPFKVTANGTTVEVLGTHFNVMAYGNEPAVRTTLLEGSVRVGSNQGNESVVIKPGQQSRINKFGNISISDKEDIDNVMAWKNGRFAFNDDDISTIMHQVERWYDAEIIYDGKIDAHFVANIPRNTPVSKLLELLELTNRVHFKIDGRKIIVTP